MVQEFKYVAPATLDELLRFLSEKAEQGERAIVINGGTDLLVSIRAGLAAPDYVVDMKKIPDLHEYVLIRPTVFQSVQRCQSTNCWNQRSSRSSIPCFTRGQKLWRQRLVALPPDEVAKVMVDALHVAAKAGDLAGVERYLRRGLRSGELNLDGLRSHYGLRPPRGLAALPQLQISEHQLSSYDELLGSAPQPAGTGNSPAGPSQAIETGPVPQPVAGSRAAGHSRWLVSSQLPLRAGGAGTPAAASSQAAAVVA